LTRTAIAAIIGGRLHPYKRSRKIAIEDRKALIMAIMRQRESHQGQPIPREIGNKTTTHKAKAEEDAAQDAWDAEKATWIEAHGSDRLKKAHSATFLANSGIPTFVDAAMPSRTIRS
jgi:hypothetical protein